MPMRGRSGQWCAYVMVFGLGACVPQRANTDGALDGDATDARSRGDVAFGDGATDGFGTINRDSSLLPVGPIVESARVPPPISGGTMLATSDNTRLVIADSDRDRVWIADVEPLAVRGFVPLEPGDEPGRVVESAPDIVHVVLRSASAIATIDVQNRRVLSRRAVCAEPRGIAVDRRANALRVACAGGELATLSLADATAPASMQFIQSDLRDVIVRESGIVVTTFRSAKVLFLDDQLRLQGTVNLPTDHRSPNTAWRAIALHDGSIAVLHQRAISQMLSAESQGYAGASATVVAGLAVVTGIGQRVEVREIPAVLPVDLVESEPDALTVIGAGHTPDEASLALGTNLTPSTFELRSLPDAGAPMIQRVRDTPTSVAIASVRGRIVSFVREPAALWTATSGSIPLERAESVAHTGHDVFHLAHNRSNLLACASCHPEGGDDGRSWQFEGGPRRSPSLRGTLAETAPYHWTGEFASLADLADSVFTGRMVGPRLTIDHKMLLRRWLESLRPMQAPAMSDADRALVTRGEAVFRSAEGGCSGCHSGPRFTNNETMDIGTGGRFQVPSLVGLRYRAPYMHTGCAATIDDRFASMGCAGDARHGGFGLSEDDRRALAAYLRSI